MKKPRSDAKLKNLAREIQASIIARLTDAKPVTNRKGEVTQEASTSIEAVLAWLKAECDIETSAGALSEFWSWYHLRQSLEVREQRSLDLQKILSNPRYGLSPEEVIETGNRFFLEAGLANGDAKLWTSVLDRVLSKREGETKAAFKKQEIALKERRLVLLEKKAEQADKAKEAMKDGGLSMEEKHAKLKEVFGIA